jgi:hypothetical protein
MKTIQRLAASLALVFVLSLPAPAGEMDMGITTPPPPSGQTDNSTAATTNITTAAAPAGGETVTTLASIVVGVWQALP